MIVRVERFKGLRDGIPTVGMRVTSKEGRINFTCSMDPKVDEKLGGRDYAFFNAVATPNDKGGKDYALKGEVQCRGDGWVPLGYKG